MVWIGEGKESSQLLAQTDLGSGVAVDRVRTLGSIPVVDGYRSTIASGKIVCV